MSWYNPRMLAMFDPGMLKKKVFFDKKFAWWPVRCSTGWIWFAEYWQHSATITNPTNDFTHRIILEMSMLDIS